MANRAKISISVTAARGSLTISYGTNGRYVSLPVNDVNGQILGSHLVSGAGSKVFWESILPLVQADITAGNGGGT